MSIDGVGKKPGVSPSGPAAPEVARKEPDKSFADTVEETRATGEPNAVSGASDTALDRVRRGEISVETYVEEKLVEATRGLQGLGPGELEAIREMLRERLTEEHGLGEWVREAARGAGSGRGT
jgi:hypothetical protein